MGSSLRVLSLILAGGKGTRLEPLTRDRAKPAVPFGGSYRIIDFALSNCLNSGLRQILVLTQYKAASLDRHINLGWRHFFCRELDEFIDVIPPQQRIDESWYQGTADAVYQNIYSVESHRPDCVLILAGDHIYKMDYSAMIAFHRQSEADLTIAALPVPAAEAGQFGVMQTSAEGQIRGFVEKPADPSALQDPAGMCLASMGIYVFNSRFLFEQLLRDASLPGSAHDFGRDLIPAVIDRHRVMAFPFRDENRKSPAYWRDVGTIDAYFDANMDLVSVDPQLNLYDRDWPIRTWQGNFPPPKFVFADREGEQGPRVGHAVDSLVGPGSIISGGAVRNSVLGPNVRVHSWSQVEQAVLLEGVEVGRGAIIRRAIIDKQVRIPPGAAIGVDPELDRQNGFAISPGGVVVVGKHASVMHLPGEHPRPLLAPPSPPASHFPRTVRDPARPGNT